MNLHPLAFNGEDDSIFHEFDNSGDRHMEYLAEHGTFADVPRNMIIESIKNAYPHLAGKDTTKSERSLYQDIQGHSAEV
jgi:hypothetical protein